MSQHVLLNNVEHRALRVHAGHGAALGDAVMRALTFPAEFRDVQAQGRRSAQGVLAREVTTLVHGSGGMQAAERISHALFSGDVSALSDSDFSQLAQDGLPVTVVTGGEWALVDLLVETGLAATPRGEVTLGQARKFVQEGAVQVNGIKQDDVAVQLSAQTAIYGKYHLLRRGKKQFHLLAWQ